MKIRFLFISVLVISFYACNETDETNISDTAQDFIHEVVDVMQLYSINKYQTDWSDFRNQVLAKAGSAQNIQETDEALMLALELLGDNHSSIHKTNGSVLFAGKISCQPEEEVIEVIPDNIGYVKVGSSVGSANEVEYATEIQHQIMQADQDDLIGWIVDLRGNGGGGVWQMIAGIGPILGEGVAGYFIDADDIKESWSYSNGKAIWKDETSIVEVPDPYTLINPNPKVAVLLDNGIASAGEAVAISFVGRDGTRSFGSATCGLATGNSFHILSNNYRLYLTSAIMADRNKNKFGFQVQPDEVADHESAIIRAIEYLQQ